MKLEHLHAAIMNLPFGDTEPLHPAYKNGHRDARHAACELVSEALAEHFDERHLDMLWLYQCGFKDFGINRGYIIVRNEPQLILTIDLMEHRCTLSQDDAHIDITFPETRGQLHQLLISIGAMN